MRMTEQKPYLLLALGLAIGGLVAALLARSSARHLMRERGMHAVGIVKEQATRFRVAAEEIAKKTREFVGPHPHPADMDSEADKQAYDKERRENLGG